MAHTRYYSPRLERPLVTALYHAAKAHRIPMTTLASRFVAEGLKRLREDSSENSVLREELAVDDPRGRQY